jgi:general secretion pathway protein D
VLSTSVQYAHASESASSYYKRGVAAEAREDYDTAYNDFKKATEKAPKDLRYREAYLRVLVNATGAHMVKGRKLLAAGDKNNAMVEFMRAAEIDPGNEAALQAINEVRIAMGKTPAPVSDVQVPGIIAKEAEIAGMGAPAILRPVSNEPLTIKMTEDSKTVYQAIGRAAGVNVLFDPDYQGKRITVDLNGVTLYDALRIVGTQSNTFWRAVTANTIFVAANTTAKHKDLDEQAVETFYLTNAWQANDLTDVQTALRNVLPNVKVGAIASQNALVVRGTPDELLLGQKLVNDLDRARPEVVVDIAVLEVSKNWERNIGLSWPSSIGFTLQPLTSSSSSSGTTGTTGTTSTSSTSSGLTLSNLGGLNSNNIAVNVSAATANLLLTDSNTKILQNPRIRSTDAQKATMKIGSRIPIATGSYGGGGVGTTAGLGAGLGLVNTQFQYQDVGVNIEMTPTVHYDHDVTLKLKIEVTAQSGSVTISSITEPILSQRTTEAVIRLREGEASILGGIINKQDTVSASGIPGLSQIPLVRYLFGNKDHTTSDDEIVFMLIPHVVRSQELTPTNLRMIDAGAGTTIQLRHLDERGTPAVDNTAPLPPVKPSRSMSDTVPGKSAESAAPAALAEMRRQADAAPIPSPGSMVGVRPIDTAPVQPVHPSSAALNFRLAAPAAAVPVGSTFAVPIQVSDLQDVSGIPLQIKYDSASLQLVNIASGDVLGKDGQAVATVHRDDPPGNLTLNLSRPPSASGISGSGVVCVLRFQAKAAGTTKLSFTKAGALDSDQAPIEGHGTDASIVIK